MSSIEARFKGKLGRFLLDVAFTCPDAGITGLFGPSGCGKTTILRCLAGLTRLPEGHLSVGGEVWQDARQFLPPHKRRVGYVFQEARLFPHLSVLGNLNYGLRRVSVQAPEITLEAIIDLLGIRHLLDRSTTTLSGGERQRIAVGRALLSQPRILLMDEPLSALDHQSRSEILPYLETLHRTLSIPIIYVSHDLSEIERLADHLVLISKEGRVQASDALATLLTDLSLPIARQPQAASILTIIVDAYDAEYDISLCRTGPLRLEMPGHLGPPGTRKRVRVHASDVSIAKSEAHETSMLNVLPARIEAAETVSASHVMVLLSLFENGENGRLLASVTRKSWDRLKLSPGDPVFAQLKSTALAEDS